MREGRTAESVFWVARTSNMEPETRLVALLMLLALAGLSCRPAPDGHREQVVVFAAASLTDVMEALTDSFEALHPEYDVVLNVAATSLLARQIAQGAPADAFVSAGRTWMRYLEARGHTTGLAQDLVGNRLVVVGAPSAPPLASLEDLKAVRRLALADPAHVPAGVYASDVRAAPDVRVLLADWPDVCAPEVHYTVARLRNAPHPEAAEHFLRFAQVNQRHLVGESRVAPLLVVVSEALREYFLELGQRGRLRNARSDLCLHTAPHRLYVWVVLRTPLGVAHAHPVFYEHGAEPLVARVDAILVMVDDPPFERAAKLGCASSDLFPAPKGKLTVGSDPDSPAKGVAALEIEHRHQVRLAAPSGVDELGEIRRQHIEGIHADGFISFQALNQVQRARGIAEQAAYRRGLVFGQAPRQGQLVLIQEPAQPLVIDLLSRLLS